jgi:predicted HNH restriction endonuclease
MDFDHEPGTKRITIGHEKEARALSEEELRWEIAKCELVCANCHREREHQRREFSSVRFKRGKLRSGTG